MSFLALLITFSFVNDIGIRKQKGLKGFPKCVQSVRIANRVI